MDAIVRQPLFRSLSDLTEVKIRYVFDTLKGLPLLILITVFLLIVALL